MAGSADTGREGSCWSRWRVGVEQAVRGRRADRTVEI